MPGTTLGGDTLDKHPEAAAIELTPLRTSRTSSEAAVGDSTFAGPAIAGTRSTTSVNDVVPEEFPTGTRLYTIFLALSLAVLIVGLV
jgi:hypothetical protein